MADTERGREKCSTLREEEGSCHLAQINCVEWRTDLFDTKLDSTKRQH